MKFTWIYKAAIIFNGFFSNSTRFLDGVADAASWNSVVSILMVMYPSKVSTVMSWTEMLFGFGYMIGKKDND